MKPNDGGDSISFQDHLANRLRPLIPLLAQGRTNDQLARILGIEKHTAEQYVSNLKMALRARDRVDLVLRCQKLRRLSQNEQF
jgi:DNA-binding NarL/FixJ family response regulator